MDNTFTKSDRQVYRYIVDNSSEVLKNSVYSLADACGVSKSAVLRFTQKIGYKGFTEFKYDFSRFVHSGAKTHTDTGTTAEKIIDLYAQTIHEMKNFINEEDTVEIVNRMIQARRVKIFGLNRDAYTVQHMRHHLHKIDFDAEAVFDPVLVSELSLVGNKRDAHIYLTVTGNTPILIEAIEASWRNGVYTVLVTSTKNAAMEKYASKVVYLPSTNIFTSDFFLDQHTTYLVWIEVLISYLGSVLEQKSQSR